MEFIYFFKQILQQESLIAPFRDQLEAYEVERAALLNQKHDAENEAKLMGMKYAQILGHQNQNQKIKHLEDLKRKNFELIEVGAYIINLFFLLFGFFTCRIKTNSN